MFGYVYKGSSYNAVRRLEKFITSLRLLDSLWDKIFLSSQSGMIPKKFYDNQLDTLIDQTFKDHLTPAAVTV